MRSQYGAYALRAALARLYARMRMHTPTRPGTYMHVRTHRLVSNSYSFFTSTMIRERASCVTLYVHCLSCLYFNLIFNILIPFY